MTASVTVRRASALGAAALAGGTLAVLGIGASAGAATTSSTTTTSSTGTSTTVPSYGAQSPSYSSDPSSTTTSTTAASSGPTTSGSGSTGGATSPSSSTSTTSPGYNYTFGPGEQSPNSAPVTGNTGATAAQPSPAAGSPPSSSPGPGEAASAAALSSAPAATAPAPATQPGSVAGILQTVAGAAALPGGPGNGPHSTVPVVVSLDAIKAPESMVESVLAPFPVAGPATYGDDFGELRGFPIPHVHQGVDIAAAEDTPLIACAPGVVTVTPDTSGLDPDGGNSLNIVAPDGTRYYYAHLASYAPGLASGQHVAPGQALGGVGMTGDATGPHLHFEIHAGGGAAVDPSPFLDRWLSQALQTAQALGGGPPASLASASGDLQGVTGPAGATPTPQGGTATSAVQLRPVSPDLSAVSRSLTSVNAASRRGISPAASVPLLAALGAGLFWIVLRYRQRRLVGLEVGATAGLPRGVDPDDPLWTTGLPPLGRSEQGRRRATPRKEVRATEG